MVNWLRTHIVKVGLGGLVLVVLAGSIIMRRNGTPGEEAGMPDGYRAYWEWVASLNRSEHTVAAGVDVLNRHPEVPFLYLRLADECAGSGTEDACRVALQNAEPPTARTELYRQAALARLHSPDDPEAAIAQWQQLAGASALDPTLARLIVDQGWKDESEPWLRDVEAWWLGQFKSDSTAVGPAFGLGYLAVLRTQWAAAENYLTTVTQRAPDAPQGFRELGRVYYYTGQSERLEQVLEDGIRAAVAAHDLEQELVLRGNLGWDLVQRSGDLDRARRLIDDALAQSRRLALRRTEGVNQYRLAYVFLKQHRYDDVLALLDSASVRYEQEIPNQYPEVVALRGITLSDMFRFSDAEDVLEKAIAEAERRRNVGVKIQALVALTQLRYRMGRYTAARESGLEALALAQRWRTKDYEIAARMALGEVERRWGNFEAAAAHLEAGLVLAREMNNDVRIRELHNRLGLTELNLLDAGAAQEHFRQMLESIEQQEPSVSLARAYLGLGRTYQSFDNLSEALRYYDLALGQLEDEGDRRLQSGALIAKAWALIDQQQFQQAGTLFEQARRAAGDDRSVAFRVAVGLGNVALNRGRYAEALKHFEKAEDIERSLQRPSVHWHLMLGKALAYWRLGERERAEDAFRGSIGVVEALRENFDSSQGRSFFVQDKVQVYDYFAAFLEEEGRSEEALYFTERARSRSLLDLLFTTQQERRVDADRPADRVIEMDRRVRALADEIDADPLDMATAEPSDYDAARVARLRKEYQTADSLYRRARLNLSSDERIYTFAPLRPDSVRALLAPGEAMIVYDLRTVGRIGNDRSASVAYVVRRDTVIARPLEVDARTLPEVVRYFREQIGSAEGGPGTSWQPVARRLYRDLVAPVIGSLPDDVTHLHIVPEGVLHYVPFAALMDADGRFLIDQFTLSVTPSASILNLARAHNPRRWRSILLMADPTRRLPGARSEVSAIASTVSPNRRVSLVGSDATQANLEELAGSYDILHFATHGSFVSRAPWRSNLQLYDDVLSVEEIGELDLDAYLVTLSACETALSGGLVSDVPDGDEWVGLNQAFLAAGTPTVMASLWPIDDRVSSTFMTMFYETLGLRGKAYALAEVQRRFLRTPRTHHPFYWASFTVIGDPL